MAVVALVGTHQIIAQIFQAFFYVNLANLPELIRTGRLDLMLLLPVDAQFAVSTRQFGMDNIVNALVGVASSSSPLPSCTWRRGPGRSRSLRRGAWPLAWPIHYAVMFSLSTFAFWIVRAQGLIYGYFNLFNIGRYPDAIFHGLFKASSATSSRSFSSPMSPRGLITGAPRASRPGCPRSRPGPLSSCLDPPLLVACPPALRQRQLLSGDERPSFEKAHVRKYFVDPLAPPCESH